MPAPDPLPHLVRVGELSYPRHHVRWLTLGGLALAGATYAPLVLLLRWLDPHGGFLATDYTLAFWAVFLLLAPVHEALHILAAVLHGVPWSAIRIGMRSGFIVVRFTEPVQVAALRIVLLAPLVVLSLPLLAAIGSGDLQWVVLLALHVGSTVADLYTWWRLRGVDGRHYFFQSDGIGIYAPAGPVPPRARRLALHTAASLGVGLLFVLVPLLLPHHLLLGDLRLSGGAVLTDPPGDGAGPWTETAFDFHAQDAGELVCSATVLHNGLPETRSRPATLQLATASGRLLVRHRVERSGGADATLHVEIAVDESAVTVLRYRFPATWTDIETLPVQTRRHIALETQAAGAGMRLVTLRLNRASGAPEPPLSSVPARAVEVRVAFRR